MIEVRALLKMAMTWAVLLSETSTTLLDPASSWGQKITRCALKKLPHNTRNRHLLGSSEIYRDRAQEYLLWWIKKCLHCAVESKIEFFFSRISLWWKKRCLRFLLEGHHIPILSFFGKGVTQ